VRREENPRQTISLPCILFPTHGKVFLKKQRFIFLENGRGEKYFAVRRKENVRQTICLPCVLFPAHSQEFVCRAFFLCRVPYKKRTAKKLFAVRPK
jgi:hypothetical protein